VVDEFTREGLAICCGRSLTTTDVMRTQGADESSGQADLSSQRQPPAVRCYGREAWLAKRRIGTHYIDPGSAWQNAYNESFNSIFGTTCLRPLGIESVAGPKP
jgi:putative transposase